MLLPAKHSDTDTEPVSVPTGRSILFLTGMPGCGKTWWGAKAASAFNLPFLDLDQYIASRAGTTIAHIFDTFGEPEFRKMEQIYLAEVLQQPRPFICSTGGGTPLDPTNSKRMQQNGIVVFLQATLDTLIRNLKQDTTQRPLLQQPSVLQQLYQERSSIYQQADYILQVETLSLKQFEPIIRQCIKQHS